jgi:hypothetical protein
LGLEIGTLQYSQDTIHESMLHITINWSFPSILFSCNWFILVIGLAWMATNKKFVIDLRMREGLRTQGNITKFLSNFFGKSKGFCITRVMVDS